MSSRKRSHGSRAKEQSKRSKALRSGKWSFEEEVYANRLIEDFENGQLEDCEDGCTLRAYLAQKLRCAPMRISKKFAGRCIGKLVFVRRQRKPGTFSEGPTLKQLEHEFLCSVHVSGEEVFAASTSSESGSDDGSEDSKQAGYTDNEVEYYIPPYSHAARHAAPAPAPFLQQYRPHAQHPPSAFSHELGGAFGGPAPSTHFGASHLHRPTVAHQHPVAEHAEADPFELVLPLADLAFSSDASGVSLDDFAADLAYLEQIDFETIF